MSTIRKSTVCTIVGQDTGSPFTSLGGPSTSRIERISFWLGDESIVGVSVSFKGRADMAFGTKSGANRSIELSADDIIEGITVYTSTFQGGSIGGVRFVTRDSGALPYIGISNPSFLGETVQCDVGEGKLLGVVGCAGVVLHSLGFVMNNERYYASLNRRESTIQRTTRTCNIV